MVLPWPKSALPLYVVARCTEWLLGGYFQAQVTMIFWSVQCKSIESPPTYIYVVTYKIVIKSRDVMFSYI